MILIGSSNAEVGFGEAMLVLKGGGPALDAVEVCIRAVESNPDDHTVGLGGLPNVLGVVELDASIMDGRTLAAGAVAAMKDYEHPITIARRVMERLPHVILAGEGAEMFAADLHEPKVNLLTDEARAIYEGKLKGKIHPDYQAEAEKLRAIVSEVAQQADTIERPSHNTVAVLALDSHGDIASGVSTSGWAWKYPGRVGDSPVIGAGNYCDNRYGACGCTGYGEMAIRLAMAHSVVFSMRIGKSLDEAVRLAIHDTRELKMPLEGWMNLVAIDRNGGYAAVTSKPGPAQFIVQTDTMLAPLIRPYTVIET